MLIWSHRLKAKRDDDIVWQESIEMQASIFVPETSMIAIYTKGLWGMQKTLSEARSVVHQQALANIAYYSHGSAQAQSLGGRWITIMQADTWTLPHGNMRWRKDATLGLRDSMRNVVMKWILRLVDQFVNNNCRYCRGPASEKRSATNTWNSSSISTSRSINRHR